MDGYSIRYTLLIPANKDHPNCLSETKKLKRYTRQVQFQKNANAVRKWRKREQERAAVLCWEIIKRKICTHFLKKCADFRFDENGSQGWYKQAQERAIMSWQAQESDFFETVRTGMPRFRGLKRT